MPPQRPTTQDKKTTSWAPNGSSKGGTGLQSVCRGVPSRNSTNKARAGKGPPTLSLQVGNSQLVWHQPCLSVTKSVRAKHLGDHLRLTVVQKPALDGRSLCKEVKDFDHRFRVVGKSHTNSNHAWQTSLNLRHRCLDTGGVRHGCDLTKKAN